MIKYVCQLLLRKGPPNCPQALSLLQLARISHTVQLAAREAEICSLFWRLSFL